MIPFRRLIRPSCLLAAAGALAACASTSKPQDTAASREGRQCFQASRVNGFVPIDDRTVDVRVGVNDLYRLEIVGVCPDIDWALGIGIRARGGSSWVCSGLDAELLVPSPTGVQTCPVTAVRKLTEAEIEAGRTTRPPARMPKRD